MLLLHSSMLGIPLQMVDAILHSGVLGIPFLDVVRVLAAVLLLGNVQFVDGQGLEVDVKGDAELKAVASLLGVSGVALFRGLTSRTHNARGQLVKSVCDANMVSHSRL
jgi:dachs protein